MFKNCIHLYSKIETFDQYSKVKSNIKITSEWTNLQYPQVSSIELSMLLCGIWFLYLQSTSWVNPKQMNVKNFHILRNEFFKVIISWIKHHFISSFQQGLLLISGIVNCEVYCVWWMRINWNQKWFIKWQWLTCRVFLSFQSFTQTDAGFGCWIVDICLFRALWDIVGVLWGYILMLESIFHENSEIWTD